MRLLRTLLVKAKRFHNSDAYAVSQQTIVHEAEVNYNLIKDDGSFGVHNIKYVKDLLDYSIAKLVSVHPPPLTPPTRGGGNFHPMRPRQRGTFPPLVPLTEGEKGGGWRSGGDAELLPKLKQLEGFVPSSNVTVHPHLNLPHQGGGIQGDNEYSPPLVGGVRGGEGLLQEKNSLCEGLTINNLNKFVVRYFEDLGASTGSVQALSGLKPNSDKTVTNPSLKAGGSGYTPYWGFSPDGTTTRSIYCQSQSFSYWKGIL